MNPDTDRPCRGHSASATSGSSAAHAAGIPLPDLGVGRLRDVAGQDAGPVGNERSPRDVDENHERDVDLDVEADRDAGPGLDDDRGLDDHDDADLTPSSTTADAAS